MDINAILLVSAFLAVSVAIFKWIRMRSARPVVLPIAVLRNCIRLNKIPVE